MKQYEYKIIVTGAVGVPSGEPNPKFKGGKADAYLEAGLTDMGKEGWLFMMHLDNPPRMFFAREVRESWPKERMAQACGNCRHWTRPEDVNDGLPKIVHGVCIGIASRTKDLAAIEARTSEGTHFRTQAEFGCFSWEMKI